MKRRSLLKGMLAGTILSYIELPVKLQAETKGFPKDWRKLQRVEIEKNGGHLTNYPILLRQQDGFIRANYATDENLALLPLETIGDNIWIKVPNLSSTKDTTIYIWDCDEESLGGVFDGYSYNF